MPELWSGDLEKMRVSAGSPVHYTLRAEIDINSLIDRVVTLTFTGNIHCCVCGKRIPKAYGEGYCYPHFRDDPANSPCVVRPELCEGHLGGGRDPDWEQAHHVMPHVVYLADSGGLKVGVTRASNMPARWIDQGAHRAMVIAETPFRQLAGRIEVALKETFSDKTNWRRMLAGTSDGDADLMAARAQAEAELPDDLKPYLVMAEPIQIQYPLAVAPTKVQSINLAKIPSVEGRLVGVRGQYLVFSEGRVLNVRRHTGFEVSLSVD